MAELRTLYPPIEPYDTGRLKVSDIHEIYYEQVGNPNGRPVVFLHGGPGGGIVPEYRQFHDPAAYRIVLFDQRGSGQSTPMLRLKRTLPGISWRTLRSCGSISGSTSGRSSADLGAAPCHSLMLRSIRSERLNLCCAESFFAGQKRSNGSIRTDAVGSSPMFGKNSEGHSRR